MRSLKNKIWVFFLFLSIFQGWAYPIPYAKMDLELKKAWDSTFPVPYEKILKKDPKGQGILYFNSPNLGKVYIYNYLVQFPLYAEVERKPKPTDANKEILVRLYVLPKKEGDETRIYLGEYTEIREKSRILKQFR
jgi:hypothetical protein